LCTQVDLYGMVLGLGLALRNWVVDQQGYANRRCVQIAITEVGYGERNYVLQSGIPFRVQALQRSRASDFPVTNRGPELFQRFNVRTEIKLILILIPSVLGWGSRGFQFPGIGSYIFALHAPR